ncbi:FkbM family methyltransferase [Terracidiphilus sp.]|jgi:FkbM family methyltransferase|uniref:FkbM family methyltransferase n=1 Tax=Terracidiphilus sp. TaxID=1964191 RepID=UPI003C2A238D
MAVLILNGEMNLDQLLAALSQKQSQIYFMQVGAFDGVTNDHLHREVRKFSLSGVAIEPQKDAFKLLQKNYSDLAATMTFFNVAIAERDGYKPFHFVDNAPAEPVWLPQLASFRRDVILRHSDAVQDLDALIRSVNIECWSFETLFRKLNRTTVDLLYIDAEGYDGKLIWSFDVPRRMPSIIVFEHKHLMAPEYLQVLQMLTGCGYSIGLSRKNIHDTIASRVFR